MCTPIEEDKLNVLIRELQNIEIESAIGRIREPFATEIMKPSTQILSGLQDLFNEELLLKTYEEILKISEATYININENGVKTIEKATRGQTKSNAWFKFRARRITASRAKLGKPPLSLIKGPKETYSNQMKSSSSEVWDELFINEDGFLEKFIESEPYMDNDDTQTPSTLTTPSSGSQSRLTQPTTSVARSIATPTRKKLKRSHNFTACEVALLIAHVKERTSEIECRKSDTDTNKIKNEAWAHVCQKFNAHSKQSIYRDVDVLKNKYNNEKKKAKKKYADEKRHLYGTGGGPPEIIQESTIDKDIAEIIGTQMTGFPSKYDDDFLDDNFAAGPSKKPNDLSNKENIEYITVEAEEELEEEEEVCKSTSELSNGKDKRWIKCTPSMLKKPMPMPLKVSQTPNMRSEELINKHVFVVVYG
ncbi:unnamed protein product [Psylliodes chrysocephalus]|uniref:Regulatory protein zeste n=1 Tax=Psylliodes chrysocephalus TaxID=3402493 RepID=A0A9P0CVN7_9CUCU|nr:unnamed protein product [Psylliodes chrysocephala]